ncbi:hypothetical protein GFB49_07675 [Epibacterium sp. SM1979]|uniref:Tetratricopeptide repeat protein n=1 Tax=Tritonibacter litoralis TaxID=2662264 RepID=A0A843YF75_9RHOB|nr:hypothetical protein [Tritonibacter litoralis]MQQ08325.1 hypothetical protein [Tritonibacter litoralis]
MNWRALTIALCTVAASAAQAETIVARSGEHDGFSRLVMRLPEGVDWSLTQNGQSGVLNINSPDVVYDTSEVFGLIPRTRLKSLSQVGPGQPLKLEMACDCQLRSHVMTNGYLVIDVRDRQKPSSEIAQPAQYRPESSVLPLLPAAPPTTGYRFSLNETDIQTSRLEKTLQSALATDGNLVKAAVETPAPEPEPQDVSTEVSEPLELPVLTEEVVPTATATAEAAFESGLLADADLLDMEEAARTATVNESERRLLQQIGRATNQGLLDLLVTEVQDGSTGGIVDPLGSQDRPLNPLDHISVTTAIDRETGLFARQTDEEETDQLCFADVEIAVHKWGTEDPFSVQISKLRNGLVKEFDKFDEDKVVELAKTYLFFGFGAEARAMLALLPEGPGRPDNIDVLEALADLLDGQPMPVHNPFSGQQVCAGHSAFWSALAEGEIKNNANTDAIQQAYALMPVHLRVHLGPRISTLFSQLGEKHMAEAALRSVERTGVEHVPEINLAEAALAELEGDTETVVEELEEEVAERSANTPQALIDLINLHYEERRALSPDVPELVGSYELENRDTDLGTDLRKAEVTSLALEGRFDEAFHELNRVTEQDGPVARAETLEPLLVLLTERASDVTFLHYGLTFSKQATTAEAAPVVDLMARRLLDLGFAEHARSLMQKDALEAPSPERKLMIAEAAVALNEADVAIAELEGLQSSEANRLRARAYWQDGDYNSASQVLLKEEDTEEAARGFWLSENYQAISGIDGASEARFGAVANVSTEIDRVAQDPEGMPPLAEARALMETSAGTRTRIEELLSRVGTIDTQ